MDDVHIVSQCMLDITLGLADAVLISHTSINSTPDMLPKCPDIKEPAGFWKIRLFVVTVPVYRLTVHSENAVVYVSWNKIFVELTPYMYDNTVLEPAVLAASTAIVGAVPVIVALFVEFTFDVHRKVAASNVDTSYHAMSPGVGGGAGDGGGGGVGGGDGGDGVSIAAPKSSSSPISQ